VFAAIFMPAIVQPIFYMRIGLFEELLLIFSLIPLVAFYYFLHQYHTYKGGWTGEKSVAKLLNATLSDDYYLINGLYFRGRGDVDHIVLGPNGIFVVETKNWRGKVTCNGDEWQRVGKRSLVSPSEQVKKNASAVKRAIEDSKMHLKGWIVPVIVFTNNRADLQIRNPTVPILKLPQLPNYITSYASQNRYSAYELELIGKEILKT
jgi:hypothetical protein